MIENKKQYATIIDNKINIIIGTRCAESYCRLYGCDFPDCAKLSDEKFDTLEAAKLKYPNIELV